MSKAKRMVRNTMMKTSMMMKTMTMRRTMGQMEETEYLALRVLLFSSTKISSS